MAETKLNGKVLGTFSHEMMTADDSETIVM
jgi:hypothetical protein